MKSIAAVSLFSALLIPVSARCSTWSVSSTADDGTGICTVSKCTFRDAISTAASGDTIIFPLPANSTITLTRGELLISRSLTIQGPGAKLLSIRRSAAVGTPGFRIFNISATGGVRVAISGLTIANGAAVTNGGGINYEPNALAGTLTIDDCIVSGNSANNGRGGGIYVSAGGSVTISSTTISSNTAFIGGGGLYGDFGGFDVTGSTISHNSATQGGGVYLAGGSNFTRSTVSANTASDRGGGMYVAGAANIISSTIVGNSAVNGGGGVFRESVTNSNLRNTIIALNSGTTVGPDVAGVLVSQGYNLIGNNSGATITPTTGDQFNVPAALLNLGPLQDNGGPTMTHALLSGSPALDRGHSAGAGTDQRGFLRPVDTQAITNAPGGDGSDIGAYEAQPDQLTGCGNTLVTNNNDNGTGSLRTIIASACNGETITFAPNVTGAINLTSGELLIGKNVTINGPGANVLSVQRSGSAGNFRIFNIRPNTVVATISGLTIANGNAPDNGGGISNTGTLTIANAAITRNLAGGSNGGGIVSSNKLTVLNSTISGNSATSSLAGGIYNTGMLNVANSTISGNSVIDLFGFGLGVGGGIANEGTGTVTLDNSTIAGNNAQFRGGGISNSAAGTVRSINTIVASNTSANGPDVNGVLISQGFNLIGNGSSATITSSQFTDQIGVTAEQLNLGPLQDNGGPTQTHALLDGSVAIDRGHSGGAIVDQRGFTRPLGVPGIRAGDGSDIGAFEVQVPVVVVEFYNGSLDHYFITWAADEIAKLDEGTAIKGWVRTGQSFKTYTTSRAGTSPVCRYYIPPGLGDSHFFGRGTDECNATGQKNPSFVLEHPAFMHMSLPDLGLCPVGSTEIYRVFSNRPDANHRYMTDMALRTTMVAGGWLAEGDGPNLVVMCAPQ